MPRIAKSPDDLLAPHDVLKLSGLEFMQAILDGTNPGPPICEIYTWPDTAHCM